MTTKNFGAGVSGYLDVDGRNFETTVYQASKPVLDSELNQIQDIDQARNRSIFQLAQSGWLGKDVLDTSSHSVGIFLTSATANELKTPPLKALVNGWVIAVDNTNGTTNNAVSLGTAPATGLRTDLVILEVWRRLLSASPSTVGKSQTAKIWKNGNVKIAGADDVALNFADDILNGAVGAETTKRVQIQYRLRVIQGVDLDAYPTGIADPTVVAFSVPTNAATPDGSATAFNYALQSSAGDGGLWRAGDGNPANTIGSVDGYIYALPLVAVFRRNTAAFNRGTNLNGNAGRPDGLTATIINALDVMDLRTSISTTGWDLQELLSKNVNFILDNTLRTEQETTPLSGGTLRGHTLLWADEIADTVTPGLSLIRTFDSVCRRFSDRPILETVTVSYTSGDLSGSVLTVDPTAFAIYPYGSTNYSTTAPDNIVILDVVSVVSADTTAPAEVVGPYADQGGTGAFNSLSGSYTRISGLGGPGAVTIDFGSPPTPAAIYVTLLISYPGGAEPTAGGLTRTPTNDYGASSFVLENPAQLPAGAPYTFQTLTGQTGFDYPHREALVTYKTLTRTFDELLGAGSMINLPFISNFVIFVPERVAATPTPVITNITTGDTYVGAVQVSNDGRFVFVTAEAADWTPSGVVSSGDHVHISYQATRPIPKNNVRFTVYYEARAMQTIRDALLGTTLTVIPRYVAPYLYTLVTGSGSLDEGYPFPSQYVQSPGVYPSSGGTFDGDHELDGLGAVSISDFNAETGFLQVPTLIPAVPEPQSLTFTRAPGDIDAEARSFFKSVPGGYIPSAFAQPLSNDKRHKNILPMIAELATDSATLGPKGTLLIVLLSRWAEFDADNFVGFDANLASNFTSASVYRLKGSPLNDRRA